MACPQFIFFGKLSRSAPPSLPVGSAGGPKEKNRAMMTMTMMMDVDHSDNKRLIVRLGVYYKPRVEKNELVAGSKKGRESRENN